MGIEFAILDFIQNLRNPFMDSIMCAVTRLGDLGAVWVLLSLALCAVPKTRKVGIALAAALAMNFILCNGIIKNLVCRIRPYKINEAIKLLIDAPNDYSFPSGHTAAAFSAVLSLYHSGMKKLSVVALPLAVLIAFSRLYLYVHYPSDVLGGIVLGSICGLLGNKVYELLSNFNDKIKLKKI